MPQEAASGLWRSEDMALLLLHMQRETVPIAVRQLGRLGVAQFRDKNNDVNAFARGYVNDVRRCEDNERRLRFFEEQLKRVKRVPRLPREGNEETEGGVEMHALDSLQPQLEALEIELREMITKRTELLEQMNQTLEYKEVLDQGPNFFTGSDVRLLDTVTQNEESADGRNSGLRFVAGVIPEDRYALFERLVYRATRGNMFIRSADCSRTFEDPATGHQIKQKVLVVFFSSQRAFDRVRKICDSQSVHAYPYEAVEASKRMSEVNDRLDNLQKIMRANDDSRERLLNTVADGWYAWKSTVLEEKATYNVMNMIQFSGQTASAECWVPRYALHDVQEALTLADHHTGSRVKSFVEELHSTSPPPTHFRTNKFTGVFQGIVHSYGIARYKEINPAVFTIVTFPFLFGIMYGDTGHGLIITVFAAMMIIKEKEWLQTNLNEIIQIIFGGRYLLFLMGLFAMYVGVLYNDTFAMMFGNHNPFWLFPDKNQLNQCDNGYVSWYNISASNTNEYKQACKRADSQVYLIGIDGQWQQTDGKLEFVNGIKMKMAVILGVIQMLLGEILALLNHIHKRDIWHIFCGFVPEVLFLLCTFGYMDVIILIKWLTNWGYEMASIDLNGKPKATHNPPSILETMTSFFLSPGSVKVDNYLYGSAETQNSIQKALLIVALLCVPILLIPIPIHEWLAHRNTDQHRDTKVDDAELAKPLTHDDGNSGNGNGHGHGHEGEPEEKWDFSEVIIKQVIHTIEYVLGTVSNTASYLRLWALSLAHAQLSEVFWEFAIIQILEENKNLFFFTWSGWAGATVGVLLLMEALSAFLHALRLHWVEFQNKFYAGDGTLFVPYTTRELMLPPHAIRAAFENAEDEKESS